MKIEKYKEENYSKWESFLSNSVNGNFMHSKKFLNYHGNKFTDFSILIYEDTNLLGILPAAIHPLMENTVVSHPGATYGGLIHKINLRGEKTYRLFKEIFHFYKSEGFEYFIYKAIPSFYNQIPIKDDIHALFRLSSQIIRSDISSTINLKEKINPSKRRTPEMSFPIYSLKKARQ